MEKALEIAAKNISKFPGSNSMSIEGFVCSRGISSVLIANKNGNQPEAHLTIPCPQITDQQETSDTILSLQPSVPPKPL